MRSLKTKPVKNKEDIQEFFDDIAADYQESHGHSSSLLRYRLSIIHRLIGPVHQSVLVEIGCGPGLHLFSFAERFDQLIGTDCSPKMIDAANKKRKNHSLKSKLRFSVDPAEKLGTITSDQADVVLCVGALEHMLDKKAVFHQVYRVLKPGGMFVCLTPNGSYAWYRHFAAQLGLNTKHLSTDVFLSRNEILDLLQTDCLKLAEIGNWTFIPKGDMPKWAAILMIALDFVGRVFRIPAFRGGICFSAVKC